MEMNAMGTRRKSRPGRMELVKPTTTARTDSPATGVNDASVSDEERAESAFDKPRAAWTRQEITSREYGESARVLQAKWAHTDYVANEGCCGCSGCPWDL